MRCQTTLFIIAFWWGFYTSPCCPLVAKPTVPPFPYNEFDRTLQQLCLTNSIALSSGTSSRLTRTLSDVTLCYWFWVLGPVQSAEQQLDRFWGYSVPRTHCILGGCALAMVLFRLYGMPSSLPYGKSLPYGTLHGIAYCIAFGIAYGIAYGIAFV